jgi:hypothetical protein
VKEQNFTMSKANNFTFAKAKTSPNDTECQFIKNFGKYADAKGAINRN